MTEQKMGTHYVREICQIFRDVAEKVDFSKVKENMISIAGELEPLAKKLYFKTQKGTEDMAEMAKEAESLGNKIAACKTESDAQEAFRPFHDKLVKIIKHVKTMKVRMT